LSAVEFEHERGPLVPFIVVFAAAVVAGFSRF
jgi:hypothetical protein